MPRFKIFFLTFLALFLVLLISPTIVNASVLFSDDFEDGSDDGWRKTNFRGAATSHLWQVKDGWYGIKVDSPSTIAESIIPAPEWTDYIYEFDMKAELGTDKNFTFRWLENPKTPYETSYGVHHTDGWVYMAKSGPKGERFDLNQPNNWPDPVHYPVYNERIYHWKVIVKGQRIQVFATDDQGIETQIFDFISINLPLLSGGIGFWVTTGSVYPTEVWFDNVIVTSIDKSLDVPYYSQNDPQWGQNLYDQASRWASDPTIDRWGCALTSASMVLGFHGIIQGPAGSTNLPDSLNTWLNSQVDGYTRGGLVNWIALTRYSRLANILHGSKVLEFRWGGGGTAELDQDLDNGVPSILEVLTSGGTHYVVANGKQSPTYSILDPEEEINTTLTAYGNQFRSTRRLLPANTNLSALMINLDEGVDFQVSFSTDGTNFNPAGGQIYKELPLREDVGSQLSGEPFWSYYQFEPEDGDYQLELVASQSGWYEFEVYGYDREAEHAIKKERVYLNTDEKEVFQFRYGQTLGDLNGFHKQVDFDQMIADINFAYDQGWINRSSTRYNLVRIIKTAKKTYSTWAFLADKYLDAWETTMRLYARAGAISDEGVEFLTQELNYLRQTVL